MSKTFVIGYLLNPKKLRRYSEAGVFDLPGRTDVVFKQLEADKPLEGQEPFDACVEKLTDIIVNDSQLNDSHDTVLSAGKSDNEDIRRVYHYFEKRPHITCLDPLDLVYPLLDRERIRRLVDSAGVTTTCGRHVKMPNSITVRIGENGALLSDGDSDFHPKYPVICKNSSACGSARAHSMVILGCRDQMKVLAPGTWIIQEMVRHRERLYKVYVLGENVFCSPRPSLPDIEVDDVADAPLYLNTRTMVMGDPSVLGSEAEDDNFAGIPGQKHRAPSPSRDSLISHEEEEPQKQWQKKPHCGAGGGNGRGGEVKKEKSKNKNKSNNSNNPGDDGVKGCGDKDKDKEKDKEKDRSGHGTIKVGKHQLDEECPKIVTENLNAIANRLKEHLGLTLFGFDLIVSPSKQQKPAGEGKEKRREKNGGERTNGVGKEEEEEEEEEDDDDDEVEVEDIYCVDINYFPTFSHIDFAPALADLVLKQHQKRSEQSPSSPSLTSPSPSLAPLAPPSSSSPAVSRPTSPSKKQRTQHH